MPKYPISIIVLSLLGIACGIYNIIFVRDVNILFLILGIFICLLSLGFIKFWGVLRFVGIVCSIILIGMYSFLILVWIKNNYHYSWGIGLIAHFPTFVWSMSCLIICILKK